MMRRSSWGVITAVSILTTMALCMTAALGAPQSGTATDTSSSPATAGDPGGTAAKNVIVLLDASGSMGMFMHNQAGMTRMNAAKAALREALRDVPTDTHIGLLVFSASNVGRWLESIDEFSRKPMKRRVRLGWAYPLGPRVDARLVDAINLPEPKYRTPLGACMMEANDLIAKEKKDGSKGTFRLLIVTDGEADDPDLVKKALAEAVSAGTIIDVIGVSMRNTHNLATKVHQYYHAEDLAGLKMAVDKVFAEVDGSGLDASGESVFKVIAPIPGKMAEEIIKALVRSSEGQ